MTTELDKKVEKDAKKQERSWTDEQLSAINTRDKTLLVSAAAGSGKTAVLTERIIRTLTDAQNPVGVNELLVVTFTKAAAAEMRERIGKAIRKAADENPADTRLIRQLMLLPSAKIRTIDSFCNDILKSNAQRVGISPDYRIGDAAEQQLLAYSVLEGMINAVYDGNLTEVSGAEEFEELADCLTDSKKMGSLSEIFYKLYMDLSCAEKGVGIIYSLAEEFNPKNFSSPEATPYGRHFIERLRELCSHYQRLYESVISELICGSEEEQAYIPTLRDELVRLEALSLADSFAGIMPLLEAKTSQFPRKKPGAELSELQEYAKECKSECAEQLRSFKSVFSVSREDWQRLYSGLYTRLITLASFMTHFDSLYMESKRKRAMFGYHDIERFVYECLWQNGEKTEVALSLAKEFRAVYIDEYQDVNALQNKIFEALSTDTNRFMVGDIKQSIYSFRSAEPEIFASMKKSFPELSEDEGSPFASVFMSSNFRCDRGIIDFVNGIFDKIFSVIGDSIGYTGADKLVFAKDKIPDIALGNSIPTVIVAKDPGAEVDGAERSAVLPEIVAERVRELIENGHLNDGSAVRPKDIAIIMRNAKGRAADYAEALKRRGVSARVADEKNFFLNSEVLLALCLLNAIDNPRRDVYLAGLLRSPIFDFSADELFAIAKASSRISLYERLMDYNSTHPEFEKGHDFISRLNRYRDIAEGIGADELIYRLYGETGLLALASKNGGTDNLNLLYSYARGFEASSYRGLSAFIGFINTVIDRRSEFASAKDTAQGDEVSVITAHTSKGLEYPIVFLVDTQKPIHKKGFGEQSRINLSENFGISFRLRTPSGLALVENPVHTAIAENIKENRLQEELRILYVALTRAREKLFVVGSTKLEPEEYIKEMKERGQLLTPHSVRKMQTFLDIILSTAPEARLEIIDSASEDGEEAVADIHLTDTLEDAVNQSGNVESKEEYLERFRYEYPFEALSRVPGKMSVSSLYPTVLDGVSDPESEAWTPEDARGVLPSFMLGDKEDKSAKRGIATHLFMQFFDVEKAHENGAMAELSRLVGEGFMSKGESELVRLDEIEAFLKSPFFEKMRKAKRLYRELRFNVNLPAELFTEKNERREALSGKCVLVQGVVDCIIEDGDGNLTLVDYKTDRLSQAQLADKSLAREVLFAKHYQQLYYYSLAIERMFGKAPLGAEVYSLALGDSVKII